MKKTIFLVLGLLISTVGSYAAGDSDMIGKKAPGFKLKRLGAADVSLDQLSAGGSVVVINFFDVKCEPCRKELPYLKELFNEYINDAKVKIRMISLDDDEKAVRKFIKENNLKIPVLMDPGGWKAGINYDVVKTGRAEIPQIFIIGKNGNIRTHIQGYKEDVKDIIKSSVEKLKKEKIEIKEEKEISIIFTNSSNGYLESCDCPENPFGGLVRRAGALKDLRKKYPDSIVLDCGDNFSVNVEPLLTEYVFKIFDLMKYDVIAVGDQEFVHGTDFLEKNIKRLPFLSANLQLCNESMCYNITSGYTIKEVAGVKIAVVSTINPDIFVLFPPDKIKNAKFTPDIDMITNMVNNLKDKADMLILLSHSGDDHDRKIASQVQGIDLIVGGHSQTLLKDPVQVGDTLIVQAGKNGYRIGRLTLKLDKSNKRKSFEHELLLLIKGIPDDKEAKKLADEHVAKIKEQLKKLSID
ncbi:redoxin domain-containing protein [Elusimicrobiota bacterium]